MSGVHPLPPPGGLMGKTSPFNIFIQVGKAEFLGRAIGKPNVLLCEEDYKAPSLEWFQIFRGTDEAGELLAAFEMFEVSSNF